MHIGPYEVTHIPMGHMLSLAETNYPELVALLMQTHIPWTGAGSRDDDWELSPLLFAYWIKELGLGAEVPKVPLPTIVQESYQQSYEKHLLSVQKMLYEAKDKFPNPVVPVSTLKNSTIVVDRDMNTYKVLFDESYKIISVDKIEGEDKVQETVNRLVDDKRFDKNAFDELVAYDTDVLRDVFIESVAEFLKNGAFVRFFKENENKIYGEVDVSECITKKYEDPKQGLIVIKDDLDKISKDIQNIHANECCEYVKDALYEEVQEALKLIDVGYDKKAKEVYDILSDLIDKYKIGLKWIKMRSEGK